MCWESRTLGTYVNQCNCLYFSVGPGREATGQVVSSQAAEQTGGPQPSPARLQPLTPGSCQAELTCDCLDVNAIKTNVLPGTGVLSDLLMDLSHLATESLRKAKNSCSSKQMSLSESWDPAWSLKAWSPLLPACLTPS